MPEYDPNEADMYRIPKIAVCSGFWLGATASAISVAANFVDLGRLNEIQMAAGPSIMLLSALGYLAIPKQYR